MNLNKAFILGNVTQDPQVRAMPSGQQVCSFSIATNRFYTDQAGVKKQDAEFHNIVAFGKLADVSSRYLTKGSLVMIEGRIKTRNWLNQAGAKQYKTEIIAETLQLGPRPMSGGAPSGQYNKPYAAPASSTPKNEDIPIIQEDYTPSASNDASPLPENSDEIDVKDIPF